MTAEAPLRAEFDADRACTAQCSLGLACVEGRCSKDLRAVAAENTVPDLGAGADAGDAAADPMAGGAGGAP